jgi:predicted nucleic acid-binding protein
MKVAVNSSPLIFLAKLGLLDLLDKLFDEAYITEAVYEETVVEGSDHEESSLIAGAEFLKKARVSNQRLVKFLLEMIDHGEAETIALALENNLDLVVLDDKDARKVARSFGLRVTGTLGILLTAKRKGLIENIKPHIETLRKNGFRIFDDIVERILKEAGEI